jgi:hypothetical protein
VEPNAVANQCPNTGKSPHGTMRAWPVAPAKVLLGSHFTPRRGNGRQEP